MSSNYLRLEFNISDEEEKNNDGNYYFSLMRDEFEQLLKRISERIQQAE